MSNIDVRCYDNLVLLKSQDSYSVDNSVSSYYSCMDCDWEGETSECDFDTEYDEFKGIDRKYPICPICGSGLDC